MKSQEITRVGALASQCDNGGTYVIVPRSWQGLHVFCILKQEYDRMRQHEEKAKSKVVGKFVTGLIEGESISLNKHRQEVKSNGS